MRCVRVATAVLVAVNAGESARADQLVDWLNGNQLFAACQQDDRLCFGYVLGVTASAQLASSVCLPSDTVTSGQLKDVVMLWLQNHPEIRHKSASSLVMQALGEKFPCN
jgi:hypothetical protein